MPRLASDGFVLSWSSRALLMLQDYLPTLLSAFGLALTGLFFRRLAKGERWSQRNARTLVHIGLLSFLALLLQPFINTLQGLVLSLDLPDGEACPERFDRTHFRSGLRVSQGDLSLLVRPDDERSQETGRRSKSLHMTTS